MTCHGYGVIRGEQTVAIPYPINPTTGEEAVGKSFHHGRFVDKLRKATMNTKK